MSDSDSLRRKRGSARFLLPLIGALALGTGAQAGPQGDGAVQRDRPNEKSIGIYIGSELTADGSTILAGFGHEPSSHWIAG